MWKSVLLVVCLLGCARLHAQSAAGAVAGRVVDDRTGSPVSGATIEIADTHQVATSGDDGRFAIADVTEGPHELRVSVVGYILVRRTVEVQRDATTELAIALAEGTGTYREEVTVRGDAFPEREPLAGAQVVLGGAELQNLRGVMLDDPFRAVQTLPGIGATDDLHSVLTIRGSDFRHIGFTVDGVPTRYLLHTVQAIEGGGSTAMINGDVLEEVTLLSGSYPQRYGNRTGGEIDFTVRPGSRDRTSARIGISGSSVAFVGEGPLGSGHRTSWLLSGRRSYLDLLLKQVFDNPTFNFAFEDVQGKLTSRLSDRQEVEVTTVAGRSRFTDNPQDESTNDPTDARSRGWLSGVAWRYTPSQRLVVKQQAFAVGGSFRNVNKSGDELDRSSAYDAGWRGAVTYVPSTYASIEAGVNAGHSAESSSSRRARLGSNRVSLEQDYDVGQASWSAYSQIRWSPLPSFSIQPGARIDRWLTADPETVSPWLNVEWKPGTETRVTVGTGMYRQAPQFDQVFGKYGNASLVPERANHFDVGMERSLGRTVRWRVSLYDRQEGDVIDRPDSQFRMVNGTVTLPSNTTVFENLLSGAARGVEFMVQRSAPNGLSGWVSYAFGRLKYTNRQTGETFDGDFDQRHAVNGYGSWRLSDRMSLVAKFRASSNYPIAGYLRQDTASFGPGSVFGNQDRFTVYYLSDHRNEVRLPFYSRLDLRANRTFMWNRQRLTLFVEVTNVYNRTNVRSTGGDINGFTGRVSDLTENLFPILPSAGLLIEF